MRMLATLATLLTLALPSELLASDATPAALLALLSGLFDSQAHKLEDEAAGMEGEEVHGWVTRTFTPIEAPAIGGHVLVATVTYGGPGGSFDDGEYQLWTLTAGENDAKVIMTPQSFKNPDWFISSAYDAQTYDGLTPDDLTAPLGAAGCPIVWQHDGAQWRGHTDAASCTSMSTQLNVELGWEWNFRLSQDAMWIDFAGFDSDGEKVYGRDDRVPWRLDRML